MSERQEKLEQEKLQLEILLIERTLRERRHSTLREWAKALGFVLAVIGAVGAWRETNIGLEQQRKQLALQAKNLNVTQALRRDQKFLEFVGLLIDDDAKKRTAGAVVVQSYLAAGASYREEMISILSSQLTTEDDPHVKQALATSLAHAGKAATPALVSSLRHWSRRPPETFPEHTGTAHNHGQTEPHIGEIVDAIARALALSLRIANPKYQTGIEPDTEVVRVDLSKVVLRDTTMSGFQTKRMSLEHAKLERVIFSGVVLPDLVLKNATLSSVRFSDCTLKRGKFQDATFVDSSFTNCTLDDADFSGARFIMGGHEVEEPTESRLVKLGVFKAGTRVGARFSRKAQAP